MSAHDQSDQVASRGDRTTTGQQAVGDLLMEIANLMATVLKAATGHRMEIASPTVTGHKAATGPPMATENPTETDHKAATENPTETAHPTATDQIRLRGRTGRSESLGPQETRHRSATKGHQNMAKPGQDTAGQDLILEEGGRGQQWNGLRALSFRPESGNLLLSISRFWRHE